MKWLPTALELVSGNWLAHVERTLSGGRWRWSVTELETVKRWPSKRIERSRAFGYTFSCKRGIEMAEFAIKELEKAHS